MNNIILNTENDMLLKPEAIHIKSIYSAINDMKGNVFTIGEHLAALKKDIKQLERDYTVFDVAKQLFSIEKSTVYNYINIYERFNSVYYRNYSLSLLTEFLSLTEHEESKFTQFSTVADVRKYKATIVKQIGQPVQIKAYQELSETVDNIKNQDIPDDFIDVESKEVDEDLNIALVDSHLIQANSDLISQFDKLQNQYNQVKRREEIQANELHLLNTRYKKLSKYQEEYRINFDTILDFILFRLDEHYCDPKHKPLEYVHKDVKYIRELQECLALNDYLKEA